MPKKDDKEHFNDYREQTQVKHEILAAYLPAYYNILKQWDKNLLFIDGFAGRGTYTKASTGETFDGSPLRALKLIAESDDFAQRVATIFIEADPDLFADLKLEVKNFYAANPHIKEPDCFNGTFADVMKHVLDAVDKLAPTFLFVDPCGVSGTDFATIRRVMKADKCETFIFFNLDGVRRTAGLKQLSEVLVDLMGSRERAQALQDAFKRAADPTAGEKAILDYYKAALKEEIGTDYMIPFRVESEDASKTSHYLIHATKHPLGFRIMKDVMWRRGQDEFSGGGLGLAQASRTNLVPLFDIYGDAIKRDILKGLKAGPLKVSTFYETWSERPHDIYCEPAYRKALLELEADGSIVVLAKSGAGPAPAATRQKRKGKPTLAKDYWVRLPK